MGAASDPSCIIAGLAVSLPPANDKAVCDWLLPAPQREPDKLVPKGRLVMESLLLPLSRPLLGSKNQISLAYQGLPSLGFLKGFVGSGEMWGVCEEVTETQSYLKSKCLQGHQNYSCLSHPKDSSFYKGLQR